MGVGGRQSYGDCLRDDEGGGFSYLRFPGGSVYEGGACMGDRVAR